MHAADAVDEYLHAPGDRRLWNESYYFGFAGDDLVGHTRLGFQPYEGRANVWLYLLSDGRTYWFRDEDVPLAECHGLHADAGPVSVSYRVVEPLVEWALAAEGECRVATTPREVFAAEGEPEAPVEVDLSFAAPDHDVYQEDRGYDAHSPDKEHYSQPGRVRGTVRLDGDEHAVEARGLRDHSWGGLRDWTPAAGGYYWFGLTTPEGDAFKLAAGVGPDGTVAEDCHGYHADGDRVRVAEGVSVDYGDGRTPDERLRAWLDGDLPEAVRLDFELEDGTERLVLEPSGYTPLGYEDRNWAATDLETPWLTSVVNRLPVSVRWEDEGRTGEGWYETMHPRVRAGD